MEPLLHESANVTLDTHYYAQHAVERGDIIAYNFTGDTVPIIKVVKAIPDDHWSLNGTRIIINGNVAVNSQGRPYTNTGTMLALYTMDNPLPTDTYLILGDNDNSADSRAFGLIDKKDIEGRITVG